MLSGFSVWWARALAGLVAAALTVLVSAGLATPAAALPSDADYPTAWGWNGTGQLGDSTTTDRLTPAAVVHTGVLAGQEVTQLVGGSRHSCALTVEGLVACWGANTDGQLGIGTRTDSPVPVWVTNSGVLANKKVAGIAAGGFHTCVFTEDGLVACWGLNDNGQLGNGSRRTSSVPVAVDQAGVLAGETPTDIAAGAYHSCAVTSTGKGVCWGFNLSGQLGDRSSTDRTRPVTVFDTGPEGSSALVQVTGGTFHTCAVTNVGAALCWGDNIFGQLGDGTTTQRSRPVAVDTSGAAAGKVFTKVSSGVFHSCALADDGSVLCWGENTFGELGDGTTDNSTVPVAVDASGVLAGKNAADLASGGQHVCVRLDDASGACWGDNSYGQLGDGTTTQSAVPVAVKPVLGALGAVRPMAALSAGGWHTLAMYTRDGSPSQFVPLTPVRVLDTRAIVAASGGQVKALGNPISAGVPVTVDLNGVVPAGATAVAYNITATAQTASGFAEVAPLGAVAGSSTVNWGGPLQSIANGYVSKLTNDAKLQVTVGGSGSAHLILDVTGAFVPAGARPDGAMLTPVERRIYDSRDADGPLATGQSRVLSINNDVQAMGAVVTPTAAAVNLTVTGTTGSGVLSVAQQATAATSTVNWSGANQTMANAVITEVAADGSFTVTNNGQTAAHVVVDLTGLLMPGIPGAMFYPMDPLRTYDSRMADPPLTDSHPRLTTYPIPTHAVAVATNTTVTGTTGTGFLAINHPATMTPTTSTLNWYESPTTRANGSIAPAYGSQTKATLGGPNTTHYIHDVAGYFE